MENGLQGGSPIGQYYRTLAVLAAFILFFYPAEAVYLSGGTGARPLALGSAFVGLADDGSAIFINPAGLAGLKKLNVISMYTEPATNTVFNSIGMSGPSLFEGVAGFGYRSRTISNLTVSTETVSFTDQEFLLAYSRQFSNYLSLGADIRFLYRGLSRTIPGYEGLNGSGTAANLSMKYAWNEKLSLGATMQNINGAVKYQDGVIENIDYNIIFGVSYKVLNDRSYLNYDISKIPAEPMLNHLGLEWRASDMLALRGGLTESPRSSTQTYLNMTAGLGLIYKGITFDYALYKQGDPSGATSHYFSLGYIGYEEPKVEYYPTPESVSIIKTKRVTFKDLPEGHWAKNQIELLATAGLVKGFSDGSFRPGQKVTRKDFMDMLSVAKHVAAGSILRPNDLLTRGEAASELELGEVARPDDVITRAEVVELFTKTPFGEAAIKRLPELLPDLENYQIVAVDHFADLFFAKDIR